MKINVPIVLKVKAENEEAAKKIVYRFMRYGFEAILEHEPATYEDIVHWNWAEIRGAK